MGMMRPTAREFVPSFTPKPTAREFKPTARVFKPAPTAREFKPAPSAREFVPTSFKAKANPAPVPSMSAQPATVSPHLPPTRSSSNDQSEANLLVEPTSSLFSSFRADGGNNNNKSNIQPTMLDRTTSIGGNKEDSTGVLSAASSITGFSGLQNPNTGEDANAATSKVGSVMTFESTSSAGGGAVDMQTSSILESICAVDQSNPATSTVGSLGSGLGLWGGSNNVTNPLPGLAGLNFTSFMGGEQQNKQSNNSGGSATATTWGTSAGGTSGSIW